MNLCNLGELKTLLEPHGFRFSKSMGQNFLVEKWVPERITRECGAREGTGVVEIGPGVGCMTRELSALAERVVAVELDRTLLPVLEITLAGLENVSVINADVLKLDLAALVRERLSGLRPIVCANIPYNITTPIITALLEARCFERLTLMVQKEVARRVCSAPGTADYSAFTVFVKWYSEPSVLFDVPRGCFFPPPKVDSSALCLVPRKEPMAAVSDERLFFRVVRAAFAQRRKTLLNALAADLGGKERAAAAIAKAGIDPGVRGERLGVPEFAALAEAFQGAGKGVRG